MRGQLAAHHISKTYGAEQVLDGVSLAVGGGDRVGVIGPNGVGKSTLLRVLAGLEPPDAGTVHRTPPDLAVAYVPQEPDALVDETLLGYLARRTGVAAAEAELEAAAHRLAADPAEDEPYDRALGAFLSLGGGDLKPRAVRVLSELAIEADLDHAVAGLSGGEEARVRLAAVLLTRVDVLLLDEPTNDLDFRGLDRLESFVAGFPGGFVIVSHDRAFLERTVTRILELEPETRRPREYSGGYGEFERMRAAAQESQERSFRRYSEERDRFESLLNARRGEARRGRKRANRRGTHALSTKVRAAEKRLERLEEVDKPWRPWELRLELPEPTRSGDLVASLESAVVERGDFRLGPLDFELGWSERLALTGANGSGKSTLLAALLGSLQLSGGRRRVGPGVTVGSLDQPRSEFATSESFLRVFARAADLAEADARTLLGRFGIRPASVVRPARSLTPGERTRGSLALLQARGVNLLVLDEPTNHLDLEAIEELERALAGYPGTVVLVTHDRRFLEAFEPTRCIRVERGRIRSATGAQRGAGGRPPA